jgi:LacI family transcriptional regulator
MSTVSLIDVAKSAGVSVTTASVVLSRGKQFNRISVTCRAKVEETAKRLGYVPNYPMRHARLGKVQAMGFLLHTRRPSGAAQLTSNQSNDYFLRLLDGVIVGALESEMSVMSIHRSENRSAFDRGIRGVQGRLVDGLIVPGVLEGFAESSLVQPDVPKVPIVVVESFLDTLVPCVNPDPGRAMKLSVSHLAELGHRHIFWVGPAVQKRSVKPAFHDVDRERLLLEACAETGMRLTRLYLPQPTTREIDYDLRMKDAHDCIVAGIAEHGTSATAAICFNDLVAVGVMRGLLSQGIAVPRDFSVIGYDNSYSRFTIPGLTSIDQGLFQIGRRAARLVVDMADGGIEAVDAMRGRVELIEPLLVVRESTGPKRDR